MKFCTKLPNFVHIGNMMSDRFFKMASAAAEYYFRFRICWCHCLQNIKIYQQTKFRRHISIHGWDITTFVFEKQTSAILEFYFRFRSRPFRRNLHVILHQATEFRPNRSTAEKNMTSYPFLKMAAAAAQYYFRFRICWCHCFLWGGNLSKPNFVNISQLTAQLTTSGFEKQTSAIVEFYFRFRSRPFCRNRRVVLHPAAEFRPNRNIHYRNMTSYQFSRRRPSAMLYLLWGNGGPPTKFLSWSEVGPKIARSSD